MSVLILQLQNSSHFFVIGWKMDYLLNISILPLKNGTAESIYSTLIDWLKKKNVQYSKLVGMGFDGRNLEFKHDWRRTHHMLSSSTAIAAGFS